VNKLCFVVNVVFDSTPALFDSAPTLFDSTPALFVSNEFFTTSVVGRKRLQARTG
jgi:hypothetical protein